MEQDGDDNVNVSLSGKTVSKSLNAPVKPTKAMVEDHEVSHLPLRNWCWACVRGRGKSIHHKAVDKPEAISTVSVDYGFFGAPGEAPLQSVAGKDLPVLVSKDRDPPTGTGALFAHPVPHKGLKDKYDRVDEYPVKVLVKDLNSMGYKRVNMKKRPRKCFISGGRRYQSHVER